MNICIFSRGHISKLRGGVDRVTDTLATELTKRGHYIYMISIDKPIEDDILNNNQYVLPEQDVCSNKNLQFTKDFFITKKIDIILNQSDIKSIFDLIMNTHYEIPVITCIHCDPQAPIKAIKDKWDEWKIKLGIKFWIKYPYLFLRKLYQYINRTKYLSFKYKEYHKKCNAVVLLSNRFKEAFIKLTRIKEASNIYAINNPNSYSILECPQTKKEKIVLFVGRLEFQKRTDRLLRSWSYVYRNFPDWKLIIVGDGPDRTFFENYSKKIKLRNVEFIGHHNPEEYYKKASILCVTSTHEGFGMVLTEALQYNVIPIAYKSFESIEDIIEHEKNGVLVKPFSTKLYSNALKKLMSDAHYRDTLFLNIKNSNIKEKFNVEKIADQWEELFKDILCHK